MAYAAEGLLTVLPLFFSSVPEAARLDSLEHGGFPSSFGTDTTTFVMLGIWRSASSESS